MLPEVLIKYSPQILVVSYLGINLCVGLFARRNQNNNDYLYAGRKLSLPALVITLVATWYGGILEIGRHTYEHGIVTWIIFCLFYYLAAAFYAIFIAPKIARNSFGSIPELIENSFGRTSGIISAIIVAFISSPAPYLIILSTILSHVFNIPFYVGVIIGAGMSMIYIIQGGFKSVVRTDIVQFILMYGGFSVILIFLFLEHGGYSFLQEKLVDTHKLQFPGDLNWSYVLVWSFIAFVTFIDPNFYQRSFAGKSAKLVQKGIFYSISLWFIFDIISITTALYAAALLPNLEPDISPYLALSTQELPLYLEGVFLVSMIAVVMSTVDSFTFVSGFTIGKDILSKVFNKSNYISYSKVGIAITTLISVFLATFFENAVSFWYITGSFAVSSILLPMLCCFYGSTISKPLLFICIPFFITGVWFVCGVYNVDTIFQKIDPMYPGLWSSYICYIILKH